MHCLNPSVSSSLHTFQIIVAQVLFSNYCNFICISKCNKSLIAATQQRIHAKQVIHTRNRCHWTAKIVQTSQMYTKKTVLWWHLLWKCCVFSMHRFDWNEWIVSSFHTHCIGICIVVERPMYDIGLHSRAHELCYIWRRNARNL